MAVLGPAEVRRDAEALAVPAGKPTELLVRLALEGGAPVAAERLIEDLWADAAATTGRNTLQSKVSQLRRALGDGAVVRSASGGYHLAMDDTEIDVARAVELAAAATAARRAGDAESAAALAADGLALFRGDLLAGAGDGGWVAVHRSRLEEVRLGLLEDHLAARVDLGGGGDVIGTLEALVVEHPLREGLWASLITALYRSGRQADALAAYTRVRTALVEELGVEPGPDLRALEARILDHSEELGASARTLTEPVIGNVPLLGSDVLGRRHDLESVVARLGERRLVSLVGPAGVGKTRLAIEAAQAASPSGGSWLVRLDGTDGSGSLAQFVAEALDVAGGAEGLGPRLASASMLLVLDNCEHLLGDVCPLVTRLLREAPSLRVLTTSQVPLGLDQEVVHLLEPLTAEDSVALFLERAGEARPRFAVDDDTVRLVEEVCRSLDGLPLAIELAAARVRSLSVKEIARRLDDRFGLLRAPSSADSDRRRALSGAIAWSYDLLFPDDQRGLWALSVFAGGASLAAVEHVLARLGVPAAAVVDVIGRLVDRSLVAVEEVDDGELRYRLLDSIRAFALGRLVEADAEGEARAAHADWFGRVADGCEREIRSRSQGEWLAVVRAERADVDAALAWSADHDPVLGLRIAVGLGWAWVVLGDGVAGAARVRGAVLAAGPAAPSSARARGLLFASWLEASAGDVVIAQADLDHATELLGGLDDLAEIDLDRHRAFLRIQQGRPEEALRDAVRSVELATRLDLDWDAAAGHVLAAFCAMSLGDIEGATRAAEAAVDLLVPAGDSWGLVHAEGMLGAVAQADGRLVDAAASIAGAADASERLGFLGQAALHRTNLGRVLQRTGDLDSAAATLEAALSAALLVGDLRMAALAKVNLARVRQATGDVDGAIALLVAACDWFRSAGGGDGALLAECLLSSLEPLSPGEWIERLERLERIRQDATLRQDLEVEVLVSDALAVGHAEAGDRSRAELHLDHADVLGARVGHVLDEADRHDARRARRLLSGSV